MNILHKLLLNPEYNFHSDGGRLVEQSAGEKLLHRMIILRDHYTRPEGNAA